MGVGWVSSGYTYLKLHVGGVYGVCVFFRYIPCIPKSKYSEKLNVFFF